MGSLENASYMKTPCTLSKVKVQARAMAHTPPLQAYCWPTDCQKPWSHAQHSNTMPGKLPQHYRPASRPCWMLTNANTTPSTENTSSSSLTIKVKLHLTPYNNLSLIFRQLKFMVKFKKRSFVAYEIINYLKGLTFSWTLTKALTPT